MCAQVAEVFRQNTEEPAAVLDHAIYPAAEAARLIQLSATRVRRWLQGYEYRYAFKTGESVIARQKPIVRPEEVADSSYASFLDLIDLLFVKQFLDRGISLQKLRGALLEAFQILGTKHFARETFFTDGKAIYLEVKEQGRAIMELLSGGQWVIAPVIRHLADQIDFHGPTGFAQRWFPEGPSSPVVVDPAVSFGRPSIVGRGITTANVYDLFVAENKNIRRVCSWMGLTQDEVESAVAFEKRIAA